MASCHDAGSEGHNVKDYCRKHAAKNRFATQGIPDSTGKKQRNLVSRPPEQGKKQTKNAWVTYWICTLTGKDLLHDALTAGHAYGEAFFPWAAQYLKDYFAGLQAEEKRPYKTGLKWLRKGSLTGEPLDCMVLAEAADVLLRQTSSVFEDMDMLADHLKVPSMPSLIGDPYHDSPDRSYQASLVRNSQTEILSPMVEAIERAGAPENRAAAPINGGFTFRPSRPVIKQNPGGMRRR
jgi:phage terminase large subunit GpA-like protein